MLRLLIRDITVEKSDDRRQAIMHVRWQGGACSDVIVDLPKPAAEAMRYPVAVVDRIRELSRDLSDPQIVDCLNQAGQLSPHGIPFTLSMIKWVRYKHAIPQICRKHPDELSVQQAAKRMAVSTNVVYYWIERGIVQARKLDGRGSWWITLTAAKEQELQDWVRNSKRIHPKHANI